MSEDLATIDQVVGANLKRIRESLGFTQAKAAGLIREQGLLYWNRDTEAGVETGRRSLNVEEAFVVSRSLGVTLAELLVGEGAVYIQPDLLDGAGRPLGDTLPRSLREVRARLAGDYSGSALSLRRTRPHAVSRHQAEGIFANAALERATERFGVSKQSVEKVARRIWGRGFEEEYVGRILRRVRKDAKPRSAAALRAATVRSLYADLRRALGEG